MGTLVMVLVICLVRIVEVTYENNCKLLVTVKLKTIQVPTHHGNRLYFSLPPFFSYSLPPVLSLVSKKSRTSPNFTQVDFPYKFRIRDHVHLPWNKLLAQKRVH